VTSYHDHNEQERTAELIGRLENGESHRAGLRRGTPLISDPGYRLVRAAVEAGITVVPIPGPSAVMARWQRPDWERMRSASADFSLPRPPNARKFSRK